MSLSFSTVVARALPTPMMVEAAKEARLTAKRARATSGKEAPTKAMPVKKDAEHERTQRTPTIGQATDASSLRFGTPSFYSATRHRAASGQSAKWDM